jgi:hypothetical protein
MDHDAFVSPSESANPEDSTTKCTSHHNSPESDDFEQEMRDGVIEMSWLEDNGENEVNSGNQRGADPNSLIDMERSPSPETNALAEIIDPQLGPYEDVRIPVEAKLHDLKITQQFIDGLKNARLAESKLDDWVLQRLQKPATTSIDENFDPILRLSIDIYLAVGNASEDTYNSIRDALVRFNPVEPILSYHGVKQQIEEISGVMPIREDMCINTCIAFTGPFNKLDICPECAEPHYDAQKSTTHKKVPRRQFYTFPIGPQIQALWRSSAKSSAGCSFMRLIHRIRVAVSPLYLSHMAR